MRNRSLTRRELYDLVWSMPMTKLAAEFGISDVGLKKVCDRHRIPTPTRGYWAKLEAGQKPKQALFAAVKDARFNQVEVGGNVVVLAIIDTQSVKCISVRGPRGYDGAKKVVGRKRVMMVDAEGHILALAVVPADVQDCDTLPTLDEGKPLWPSLRLAVLDGVFRAKRCEEWCNVHGMRCEVVKKDPDQKGPHPELVEGRRAEAALGRRAHFRLVQSLGRPAARARRPP